MLPILETKRCILKQVCMENAKDIFEYAKEDAVVEYMTFSKHESLEYTKKFVSDFFIKGYEKGMFYDFGITYKEDGKFIGTSGFSKVNDNIGTIGYCLNPKYWNMGIMTEVVNKLIEFGFKELKLDKIEATFYDGNERSEKVMKKCKMEYVGSEVKKIKLQGEMVLGKVHTYQISKK